MWGWGGRWGFETRRADANGSGAGECLFSVCHYFLYSVSLLLLTRMDSALARMSLLLCSMSLLLYSISVLLYSTSSLLCCTTLLFYSLSSYYSAFTYANGLGTGECVFGGREHDVVGACDSEGFEIGGAFCR